MKDWSGNELPSEVGIGQYMLIILADRGKECRVISSDDRRHLLDMASAARHEAGKDDQGRVYQKCDRTTIVELSRLVEDWRQGSEPWTHYK